MVIKIHHTSLTELQQALLAAYFYFMLIDDAEAAEVYGEQFDKLYHYDNSHNNIYDALNW